MEQVTAKARSAPRNEGDAASRERLRLVLYDGYPLVCHGLQAALQGAGGVTVCGLTGEPEALIALLLEHGPDVAVIGITSPNRDGLSLLRRVCHAAPDTRVLVLAMDDDPVYAERVLRSGARGFLPKSATADEVVTAVKALAEGEVIVSKTTAGQMLQQIAGKGTTLGAHPLQALSQREAEVYEMIGAGMSRQEIARRLSLATKTVDAYRTRIKAKLDINTLPELVRSAIRWGEKA